MDTKKIGIIILSIGLLTLLFVSVAKIREDRLTNEFMASSGSCFLDDGTCLHKSGTWFYIFGYVISVSLIGFGVFLTFFDKTQEFLEKSQKNVERTLKEVKEIDNFNAYVAGFNDDEKNVLKAIHDNDQDGILQSTLRYRTGMSKTSLSLMLKNLEERDVVTRKPEGKTNKVFLRKKY